MKKYIPPRAMSNHLFKAKSASVNHSCSALRVEIFRGPRHHVGSRAETSHGGQCAWC